MIVESDPLRKPGCRPWVPPALLVASAGALDGAIVMSLLPVPQTADSGARVIAVVAAVVGVVSATLVVLGVVLAMRWAGTEEPKFVGWYTVLLLVLGILGVLPMLVLEWLIRSAPATEGDAVSVLRLPQAILAACSTALLVTAVLRAMRSRAAAALTTCVSLCLLPLFPFGTAFGIVWIFGVRTRETSPS